jgi:hypothetical protein
MNPHGGPPSGQKVFPEWEQRMEAPMKRMREWERRAQEDEERRRRERARRVERDMEQMLREEARGRDQVMEGYRRFWQRARETQREFQNLEEADSEPEALREARWVIRHAR